MKSRIKKRKELYKCIGKKPLTPIKTKILLLTLSGYSTKQISQILGTSTRNIRKHKSEIFECLEVPEKVPKSSGKGSQKSSGKGSFCQYGVAPNSELTPTQKEVLDLITEEYKTPKQIAFMRGTTVRAVNKIIQKLRQKGALTYVNQKGCAEGGVPPHGQEPGGTFFAPKKPLKRMIRLHGQQFKISLKSLSTRYKNQMQKANTFYLDNNCIKLWSKTLEIYSNHDFIADNADKAFSISMQYWRKFFYKLENLLQIPILKGGFKIVKEHYAEIDNEMAKEANRKRQRIEVKATEDNKTWLQTDNSFKNNELEFVHPITAKLDAIEVLKHFNDIRDNKPPVLSKIYADMKEGLTNHSRILQDYLKFKKYYIPHINEMIKIFAELTRQAKQYNDQQAKQDDQGHNDSSALEDPPGYIG